MPVAMPEAESLKLYNLPQRVEGGIPIQGFKDENGNPIVVLFHHLDGMYSFCTIEGTDKAVHLSASTPLAYVDGEYHVQEDSDES